MGPVARDAASGERRLVGIAIWFVTLVGGMLLRQASHQGTALPFVIVATVVLAALLVVPRLVVGPMRGRRLS